MSTNCTNSQFPGQSLEHLQMTMVAISTTVIMESGLKEVQIQLWHGILLIGMGLAFKIIIHQVRLFPLPIKQACQSLLQTAFQIYGTNIVQRNSHWSSCVQSGLWNLMNRMIIS